MPKTTDEVDTSTEEESQVDTFDELEKDDTSFEDFEDDSDDDDESDSESGDDFEESDEDESANESDEETEEESDADQGNQSQDEEADEKNTLSEDEVKQRNDAMAQKRIADREAREKAKQEQADKYLSEATDDENLALRQLQVDAYNNRIEFNHNKLETGIDKAIANIDLFRTGSKVAKEELVAALDDFEEKYVQRDKNGDAIKVSGDVYEYLQKQAARIQRLTEEGARSQTKKKISQKSRVDTLPTRAPKKPKVDEDIAGFDDEANRY